MFTEGDTDTRGRLYDADCLPVNGMDYDTSGGSPSANFDFSVEALPAGVYYVEVRGQSGSDTGPYRLNIEGDFANDDHGVDCATATVVRDPVTLGELSVFDDRDFFQVQIREDGGQLTVFTEGDTDTRGRLYDADCLPVNGMDYDTSGGSPSANFDFSVEALPAGVYYVEVRGQSGSDTGPYRLNIGGADPPEGTCNGARATITGTDGDDVLTGTPARDVIVAFGGNDVVYGLGGNDLICGGPGDDVLYGGDGNDRLFGEAGSDVLLGGDGDDTLDGGTGRDVCDGGTGQSDSATSCEVTSRIP